MTEGTARTGSSVLCHEWLATYGGSEQVSARIAAALGVPIIYTTVRDPDLARKLFPDADVRTIARWSETEFARSHWTWMLPLMIDAWSRLDLAGCDLVLTSSHACTNAVRAPLGAMHVSYTHTPMRYAWLWRQELARLPGPLRPLWPAIAAGLRRLDSGWARRVDLFIANSRNVAERIARFYGRRSVVVHPPVDTSRWTPPLAPTSDGYFLFAGRCVGYKRPDMAVEAAVEAGRPLVVAGDGPLLPALKRRAAGMRAVTFVESPSDDELRDLYRGAEALLCPGEEDFGMTVVEALACGTPVIAFGRGGASEILDAGTGVLVGEATVATFADAIARMDKGDYAPEDLRAAAARFDARVFDRKISAIVDRLRAEGPEAVLSDPEMNEASVLPPPLVERATALHVLIDERGGAPKALAALEDQLSTAFNCSRLLLPARQTRGGVRGAMAVRRLIRSHIAEHRADLVHAHGVRAAFFARLAMFGRHRIPYVVTVQGLHSIRRTTGVWRYASLVGNRVAIRGAAAIFAVSLSDGETLEDEHLARPGRIVYTKQAFAVPADIKREDARALIGLVQDVPLILWLGRFDPQKDPRTFVAASTLVQGGSVLMMVGDGPEGEAVRDLAGSVGSPIRFEGWQTDPEPYLRAADVLVSTAAWEGLPVALLEGAACGLALVATDVPGNRDLADLGIPVELVPLGDAAAVAKAIEGLLDDPIRRNRMGAEAREAALALSREGESVAAIVATYRKVLRTSGRGGALRASP